MPRIRSFCRRLVLGILLVISLASTFSAPSVHVSAWDTDWLVDFVAGGSLHNDDDDGNTVTTLGMREIGELRVRDLKRRLTRTHGYSAEEVGRMLDKQELIHALAFEEHKLREKQVDQQKRVLVWRGIIGALISVVLVLCWPLLSHAWEVGAVNFVVYTDRKRLETQRCFELQSLWGFIGIVSMFVVDGLLFWLSSSILLSWVMTSPYFFPMPSLPIRPAQLMGGQMAEGPMARYGFNVGPMIVSWGLRYLGTQLEKWTGQALAKSQLEMKRKNRMNETQEAKEERRARKAARRAAREEAVAAAAATQQQHTVPTKPQQPANDTPQTFVPPEKEPPAYDTSSASVEAFLGDEFGRTTFEVEEETTDEVEGASGLDALD